MTFEWSHAALFRLAVTVISIAMALYHMWAIAFGSPEAIPYRGTHLLFAIVLIFLIYRTRSKSEDVALAETATAQPAPEPKTQTPSILDYALLLIAAAPIVYLFVNYEYITNRIFYVD